MKEKAKIGAISVLQRAAMRMMFKEVSDCVREWIRRLQKHRATLRARSILHRVTIRMMFKEVSDCVREWIRRLQKHRAGKKGKRIMLRVGCRWANRDISDIFRSWRRRQVVESAESDKSERRNEKNREIKRSKIRSMAIVQRIAMRVMYMSIADHVAEWAKKVKRYMLQMPELRAKSLTLNVTLTQRYTLEMLELRVKSLEEDNKFSPK